MLTKIFFSFVFLAALSASANPLTTDEANVEIKAQLDKTEIASAKHYCVKGTMTCRTMYTLKDKATGKPVEMFYDSFYSADRQVGSTCYFVPNASSTGSYHQVSDTDFDGKLGITMHATEFAKITGDETLRVFSQLYFARLGTTRYILGSMTQTEDKVTVEGIEFDKGDPAYNNPVRIEYLRIYP